MATKLYHLPCSHSAWEQIFGVAYATFGLSLWYTHWLLNKLDAPLDDQRFPAIARWFSAISERESFQLVLRDYQQAPGLSTLQKRGHARSLPERIRTLAALLLE